MNFLYHGSIISGIKQLKPVSTLNGTDKKVVYLTDNIPYSLFYIWDKKHNHFDGKYVTAWIKNGTAYYEEQFPDQLKAFYSGVSGYLYIVRFSLGISAMECREQHYYSTESVDTEREEFIPNVYNELIKYEMTGELKVRRFNEQSEKRKNELIDMISQVIVKNDYIKNPNTPNAEFYRKYFTDAWKKAAQTK